MVFEPLLGRIDEANQRGRGAGSRSDGPLPRPAGCGEKGIERVGLGARQLLAVDHRVEQSHVHPCRTGKLGRMPCDAGRHEEPGRRCRRPRGAVGRRCRDRPDPSGHRQAEHLRWLVEVVGAPPGPRGGVGNDVDERPFVGADPDQIDRAPSGGGRDRFREHDLRHENGAPAEMNETVLRRRGERGRRHRLVAPGLEELRRREHDPQQHADHQRRLVVPPSVPRIEDLAGFPIEREGLEIPGQGRSGGAGPGVGRGRGIQPPQQEDHGQGDGDADRRTRIHRWGSLSPAPSSIVASLPRASLGSVVVTARKSASRSSG